MDNFFCFDPCKGIFNYLFTRFFAVLMCISTPTL